MAIEGFNYNEFSETLSSQAGELLPEDFEGYQRNYVINTIKNFASLAGEAIYNDTELNLNLDQALLVTQIIAEWSFHKSCDLIRSGINSEHWDWVMQKIAYTIFEIAKQSIKQNIEQDQMLKLVEHHVKQAYNDAIEELRGKGLIDEDTKEKAEHQSNIDIMMNEIQKDKEAAMQSGAPMPTQTNDQKILKLASVALLLKQLSQDKVQTILNKFSQNDAQTVIQYMQMTDLEDKVDKSIAIKCLKEIKLNLPEPKIVNPNKIVSRLQKVFQTHNKEKVTMLVNKERAGVQRFVDGASEGEYYQIPTKVANIIAQHVEDSV